MYVRDNDPLNLTKDLFSRLEDSDLDTRDCFYTVEEYDKVRVVLRGFKFPDISDEDFSSYFTILPTGPYQFDKTNPFLLFLYFGTIANSICNRILITYIQEDNKVMFSRLENQKFTTIKEHMNTIDNTGCIITMYIDTTLYPSGFSKKQDN